MQGGSPPHFATSVLYPLQQGTPVFCLSELWEQITEDLEVMRARVAHPGWTLKEKDIHNPNRNGEKNGSQRSLPGGTSAFRRTRKEGDKETGFLRGRQTQPGTRSLEFGVSHSQVPDPMLLTFNHKCSDVTGSSQSKVSPVTSSWGTLKVYCLMSSLSFTVCQPD